MRNVLLWCACILVGGVVAVLARPRPEEPAAAVVGPARPVEDVVPWPPGWTVEGVVRDAGGAPVASAWVFRVLERAVAGEERTDAAGRFRFTDVRGDETLLRAVLPSWPWWEPEGVTEVRVSRGAKDVAIAVDLGLSLVVRLENPAEYGMRHDGADLFVRRDGREVRLHTSGALADEFRFVGLRADDECTFWMRRSGRDAAASRHVHATGLRPGPEVRLRVERGRSITGRLVLPEGAGSSSVRAGLGGIWLDARVRPDATFELPGLPEGTTWAIEASSRARPDAAPWRGQATARPGDDVAIEMTPREAEPRK